MSGDRAKNRRMRRQTLISVLALMLAAATAWALIVTREEPSKQERTPAVPLVEVTSVAHRDVPVVIHGQGTVRPKVQASIVPQVTGRVLELHPGMISGGFISAGEVIMRIDPADYELALKQANAELAQATAARETAQAQIAEAQAKLADAESDVEQARALAAENVATRREVDKYETTRRVAAAQLHSAEASLASAEARYAAAGVAAEQAQLNLDRTTVTLPFDALVTSETVDVGQHVTAGQAVGEVYGAEAVEIPVPLDDSQLAWFSMLPLATNPAQQGLPRDQLPLAEVQVDFAGRVCTWQGRVIRTEGRVDPVSRMVHVIVEVLRPLETTEMGKPPLMPGTFATVEIHGRELTEVASVPRHALREDDMVWVVTPNGELDVRPVVVARRDRNTVYINGGLKDGERVVTSAMDVVTDGMQVRVPEPAVAGEDAERRSTIETAP